VSSADSAQGRDDPDRENLESPYWQLDDPGRQVGLWQMIRQLPAATMPVIAIIWRATPRAALTIVLLQVASGVALSFGLLATTGVLEGLLTAGPSADRVTAALPALALVVAAFAVRGAMDAGVALAQARVVPAVRREAEERLLDAALQVELAAFDDARFYDRLHRARDRGMFHLEQATDNLVQLIGAAFAAAAAASSLGVLHPALVPLLAISVLPEGWAVLRAARLGYAAMTRTVTLNRRVRMISDLGTEREPAAELRACQARRFVLDEYRQVADLLQDQEVRVGREQAYTRAAGRAFAGVAIGATFLMLGVLLHAGWIPLAVAGTAVIAIRSTTAALTRLVLASNELSEQGLYVADYQAFLVDAQRRRQPSGTRTAPATPQRITLQDVGFRYPGSVTGRYALRGIGMTIEAGQTIALVGENGSGKTTLAKLIAGLYRPTSGQISWDGIEVSELDAESVADRLVMVLQDPVRWPHTARANIRVGRHDRDDPGDLALREAARQACADEVVAGLPYGWDTLLSRYFRDGQELSGGQWQRLAVARGLFRDAPLLIWDEPTAPLDVKTEYAVYESLRQVARRHTVILITHRLASIRNADQIYLLHDGAIVERGTHAELLEAAGRYADMHALQAQMYNATPEQPRNMRGIPIRNALLG